MAIPGPKQQNDSICNVIEHEHFVTKAQLNRAGDPLC